MKGYWQLNTFGPCAHPTPCCKRGRKGGAPTVVVERAKGSMGGPRFPVHVEEGENLAPQLRAEAEHCSRNVLQMQWLGSSISPKPVEATEGRKHGFPVAFKTSDKNPGHITR